MEAENKPVRMGGQAVMEGVMIKSENFYSVSVRKGKEIVSKVEELKKRKSKVHKWPIVRGFFNLVDMMFIGMGALMWSAEQSDDDEEGSLSKKEIMLTVGFSILAVILFFIVLPYFATNFIGFKEESNPVLFNIVDGFIRIGLFLLYVWGISFMKDIQRIFQYHGAEHMAIHAQEKGLKLSIENIRKFRTMHPRCGTSFLLLVFILSVVVFSLVPGLLSLIYPGFLEARLLIRKPVLFLFRILLIPVIAGLSYEILRASDKFQNSVFFRMISYPGILLQKITTSEPSDDQIEVAVNSVNLIVEKERSLIK